MFFWSRSEPEANAPVVPRNMEGEGDRVLLEVVRSKPDLSLPELAQEVTLRTGIRVGQMTVFSRLKLHGVPRDRFGSRG